MSVEGPSGRHPSVVEEGPILVVDDDPDLRAALAEILEREGHRVLQAPDGPTAVRLTREHAPDLVVLDQVIPGLDLDAVRGQLRRELDRTPALLEKPFNVSELLAAVERCRRQLKLGAL